MEGATRYLSGASLADIAEWSQDGGFEGRTPMGRARASAWWIRTLTNPKVAAAITSIEDPGALLASHRLFVEPMPGRWSLGQPAGPWLTAPSS